MMFFLFVVKYCGLLDLNTLDGFQSIEIIIIKTQMVTLVASKKPLLKPLLSPVSAAPVAVDSFLASW